MGFADEHAEGSLRTEAARGDGGPDMDTSILSQTARPSGLPRPNSMAFLQSPGKSKFLAESSESEINRRAPSNFSSKSKILSKMQPPPPTNLKHKLPGNDQHEPEPKRKTLAQMAGEPRSVATALPVPRGAAHGMSLVAAGGFGSTRNPSFSSSTYSGSSTTSRTTSGSSRVTSNGSFASSMGPGASRPQSRYGMSRNQSFSKSTTRQPSGLQRPKTAVDRSFLEDDERVKPEESFDRKAQSDLENFRKIMEGFATDNNGMKDMNDFLKQQNEELKNQGKELALSNQTLLLDLDSARRRADEDQQKLLAAKIDLDEERRSHRIETEDLHREHRNEIDQLRRDHYDDLGRLTRSQGDEKRELERQMDDRIRELERAHNAALEEERTQRQRDVQTMEGRIATENQNLDLALQKKDREIQNMRAELEDLRGDLDREKTLKEHANSTIVDLQQAQQKAGIESATTIQTLENALASLRARIHFLESGSKAQSDSFAEMEARLQEAVRSAEESKKKLIKEETLRRLLFNQVQELKGNIRVMCRVRPVFNTATESAAAKFTFPDVDRESKELEIQGKEEKSSLGTVTRKNHSFSFDRVFGPSSKNEEVFGEISQLVQSALDGYNVCIFCYGQTGSGKTHTMSSADGMIPRATHQIYESATALTEKGWTYTMEGNFVEVYNEEIHDLLGGGDRKKHEIKHDDQRKQTTVTNLKSVTLDSPNTVETMLKMADNNRSVAATKSNERSSRSHSVFILKLKGKNSTTGESCEGTLNLVDLAGSERLKSSGAEGDRMKETQNINKSLSCLGDVIAALGQGKEGGHIPYRNSKLTYLLQYSLGGNSKTLMFVMASPLEAHLQETLTSLKFATKVHNTHIGTAKKTTKVRSSDI